MNQAVGERKLTIGERVFILRPSWDAFAQAEDLSGKTVQQLFSEAATALNDTMSGGLGLKSTVALLYACARAGGNPDLPSYSDFGNMVFAANYRLFGALALEFLIMAFAPSDRAEKKTEVSTTPTDPSKSSSASP